jgi:hypothetical protein
MDMLPPQAPPAYETKANQSAIDTLQRMRDVQDWLVEQQAALPDPQATQDTFAPFLDALDAFWETPVEHAPGEPLIPRRQALALRLAQVARDDAALRYNDGTFSIDDLNLVRAVAALPGEPLPGHRHVGELLEEGQPQAGALVLQDDRFPNRMLLFTVDAGWQAIESTDIRAIEGDAFDTLARRLIAELREEAEMATTLTPDERPDALHAALDLNALLDVHAIVRHRDLALAARRDEERLADKPAIVREHWRRTAGDYRESAYRADDLQTTSALSLEAFTLDALDTELRKRGIAVPTEALRVRLSRRTLENGPITTAISGFAQEELTLTELAYRNLGRTDGVEVIHADGSSRSDVPADVLRDIVRGLDLPNAYANYLDNAFGNTPQGAQQRAALVGLLKARMRFEAADARLSYYDDSEPRSFLPTSPGDPSPRHPHASGSARVEHGFQLVNAVLDHPHPNGRKQVGHRDVVVHQLTYKGEPLTEVFLITARGTSQVVVYTPGAPDGIAFREFAGRQELTRDFLLNRRVESYLLDRLPFAFGEPDPKGRGGKRRFKVTRLNGDRALAWVFPFLGTCQGCTELAEDFAEREVTGDFLDVAYDDAIALAKRNAGDVTRSTAAADTGAAWDVFWNWNLPVQLTRELVHGVVQSVPRAAQGAWRFYDHVKAGESADAFLAFVDGYTAALNVLPLYTQVPALSGARVRAAAGSRTLVSNPRTVPAPDTLFPKKYLARDVVLPASEPASGVFHVVEHAGTRHGIIRQDGKLYHVRFDTAHECWRLDQPHNATGYRPAIERAASGRWHYREVGLRGGNPYEDLLEVQELLANQAVLDPSVAVLSEPQRVSLISHLHRSLPFDDFALTLRTRVAAPGTDLVQLTSTQQQAWNEALRLARATPRDAPAPTLTQALGLPESLQPQAGPSWAQPAAPANVPAIAAAAQPPVLQGWSWAGIRQAWTRWRPPSSRLRLTRGRWPSYAYVYLSADDLAQGPGNQGIALRQLRRGHEVVGVPVTTLPPSTPMSDVPKNMRPLLPYRRDQPALTLGEASNGWILIRLNQLPTRHPWGHVHRHQLYGVPRVSEAFYLRTTEMAPRRTSWRFSNEPVQLAPGQYQIGYPPR